MKVKRGNVYGKAGQETHKVVESQGFQDLKMFGLRIINRTIIFFLQIQKKVYTKFNIKAKPIVFHNTLNQNGKWNVTIYQSNFAVPRSFRRKTNVAVTWKHFLWKLYLLKTWSWKFDVLLKVKYRNKTR